MDLTALVEVLDTALEDSECAAPAVGAGGQKPLRVSGLLPCPVRIPLEEAFAEFREGYLERTGRDNQPIVSTARTLVALRN